jgi:hypothetical protein
MVREVVRCICFKERSCWFELLVGRWWAAGKWRWKRMPVRELMVVSGIQGDQGRGLHCRGITCTIQKEEKVKSKIIKTIRNNKNK